MLQDLAEVDGGLGPTQTRHLIQEYRGRQAMCDFGPLSESYRNLLKHSWGLAIGAEHCPLWQATCYVATVRNGPLLIPDESTLPGWSGANQIPLHVRGTKASIVFGPKDPNMSCQLVYRTTDGKICYSAPVSEGLCSIALNTSKTM